MKKILINAVSVKEGGAVIVLTRMLREMCLLNNNIHWYVVIDAALQDKIISNKFVTILLFPWINNSVLHFVFWNEYYLPFLLRKMHVDLLFSHTNTLPFRKLICPAVLLLQHAGYFSDEFTTLYFQYTKKLWRKIGWWSRNYWVRSSLKKATQVTVQTEALSKKIIAQLPIENKKISVILHGAGLADGTTTSAKQLACRVLRIGYVTKYGVQKNFEVLFKAAAILKVKKIEFSLILTLDENHPPFKYINDLIKKYDIANEIENHGEISELQIQKLYQTLDLFVFPSLCESFGFTLVEAIYYGLPIIASDTDSNREILGGSGILFDRYDDKMLAEKIISLIDKPDYYRDMSVLSIQRSRAFSWRTAARDTLTLLMDTACSTN